MTHVFVYVSFVYIQGYIVWVGGCMGVSKIVVISNPLGYLGWGMHDFECFILLGADARKNKF